MAGAQATALADPLFGERDGLQRLGAREAHAFCITALVVGRHRKRPQAAVERRADTGIDLQLAHLRGNRQGAQQ
jgi:hypothetical protein